MRTHSPDYILLCTVIILIILGILILASVSTAYAQIKFGSTSYFFNHQIIYGLIPGLILGIFAYKISLSFLRKFCLLLFLTNLMFLIVVFLPKIGPRIYGASRWVNLGPLSFQPSEFLKLTFILYISAWLASVREKKAKKNIKFFIAFFIIIGAVGLILVLQPDISTLIIITTVALLIYFLSDTPIWHIFLVSLISLGLLLPLIHFMPYRASRIFIFLNPEADPMGQGYQTKQALITAGSGGIFGLGLGMSRQKFGFLPESISDAIFVVFAEETGFLGSLILILLFLIFIWRVFVIAKRLNDDFSKFTALGISIWITLQAFVNIGGMIGVLPVAGVPLPFISYGGSALISELIGVGILLNISRAD
jgi:cell division protein FtsW